MTSALAVLVSILTAFMTVPQFPLPGTAYYAATSMEVGVDLDFLATSNLMDFYSFDEEMNARVRACGETGCHSPDRILLMTFDAEQVLDRLIEEGFYRNVEATDEERALMYERYTSYSFVVSALTPLGTGQLAIIGACNAERSFLAPRGSGSDAIALLVRDDTDTLIACVFAETGSGILTVTAFYLPAELGGMPTPDYLATMAEDAFAEIWHK